MRNVRYHFDSLDQAAEALLTVLLHARDTPDQYSFGPLKAQEILDSGLLLQGNVASISAKLNRLAGAVRYDE